MSHTIALVERDALQHELETVFDASTAETLLRVFEMTAQRDD